MSLQTERPPGDPQGVEAFIGVGSNLDPRENILRALPEMRVGMEVISTSGFYYNPAYAPDGRHLPFFVNGILRVRTTETPWELKYRVLRGIERKICRKRTRDRYSPRTLDLDLLLYGNLEVESEGLRLPDPEIFVRPFLALPLAEMRPDLPVPGTSLSLHELVESLDTRSMLYLGSFTDKVRRALGCKPPDGSGCAA